jgi:hypothetical protein
MSATSDTVLEARLVREVTAVFRSRDALQAAIDDLLLAGFDRADIDLVDGPDAVQQRLGTVAVPAEELADVPGTPRMPAFAPGEAIGVLATFIAVATFLVGAGAAYAVLASGGSWGAAIAAAIGGAAAGAIIAYAIYRLVGAKSPRQIEPHMVGGGYIIWVRVNSAERQRKAEQMLRSHGGDAVHPHEIPLGKHVEDIPLANVRPDPWLGPERLGEP